MSTKRPLRLLASTNNEKGDLFTRLVSDIFYVLGYDDLRFDTAKPGRELDIQGDHRYDHRKVRAECKAMAKKASGADVNKFRGVLAAERDQAKQPVEGYFLSLSGFPASAYEQETQLSPDTRIHLVDGDKVIEELTRSNIFITSAEAAERAGRCAEHAKLDPDTQFESAELLGHSLGYIWALFYARGKEQTHLALVHADGNPLSAAAAEDVIEADRKCKGTLHELSYLAPPPASPDRQTLAADGREHYRKWLDKVCGHIQLDGLPAEGTIASKSMVLENLFVPLKLQPEGEDTDIVQAGQFLAENPRFSILAKPGGGKSTLLKRLAVAYADPERRLASEDDLPERDWLPLFVRCRDLRERSGEPIRELLCDLGRQAEMKDDLAEAFREQVDDALNAGRALLLVDGLDEFADTAARTTFADHLRTFLAMYPQTALVVTSREAGFRQIAGVVASVCESTTMAPFNESDVHTLCERWHAEVLPDTKENREEALNLANKIWENERIRVLVENPLMLTTLLVVKRNVGELPTKRVKLYAAAINVLIRTWNVEGFEPLNEEETLARLSYVAVAMMKAGQQRIGRRQLLNLLRDAQQELEAELSYAEIKPNAFIERVEYRSSLLMQTGHEEIDGLLEPVYEFRHLTFQEYLAARGLVEEQYPGRNDSGEDLVGLLAPHFKDEAWREVVPLAAVLAGRKAEPLIRRLTEICAAREFQFGYPSREDVREPHAVLLRRCMLDETLVNETTRREALGQLARHGTEQFGNGSIVALRGGRFGKVFEEVALGAFWGEIEQWENYLLAVEGLGVEQFFGNREATMTAEAAEDLKGALMLEDRIQQGVAALSCFWAACPANKASKEDRERLVARFRPLRDRIATLLNQHEEDEPLALCLALALFWLGTAGLPDEAPEARTLPTLLRLGRNATNSQVQIRAQLAFSGQPLLPRDAIEADAWGEEGDDEWLTLEPTNSHKCDAILVLAWYRGRPWSAEQLLGKLKEALSGKRIFKLSERPAVFRLLEALEGPGRRVLDEWKEKQSEEALKGLSYPARRILGLD